MQTPRPFDYERRQRDTRDVVEASESGALVTTSPADIMWLCGLSSSNVAAVVMDEVVIVTDGRYAEQARATGLAVVVERDVDGAATSMVKRTGRRRENEAQVGAIRRLRAVKDQQEVAALQEAARISVAALADLTRDVRVGDTERGIARRLEYLMWRYGAHDRSFPSIVASGPNSAIPHHAPTDREIGAGELLKVDFGAEYRGYHADVTRTFVVGAEPTGLQIDVHAAVSAGAAAARGVARAGANASELDAAAREVIGSAGFGEGFVHGLGHGVGLEVHESPLLSAPDAGTLSAGNVVTIEPGVYLPGQFGVRIEDMCLIQPDTSAVLSELPRDLLRVG